MRGRVIAVREPCSTSLDTLLTSLGPDARPARVSGWRLARSGGETLDEAPWHWRDVGVSGAAEVRLLPDRAELRRFGWDLPSLYHTTDGAAFASEPNLLLSAGLVSTTLSFPALLDCLATGAPVPPETLLADLRQLVPEQRVELGDGWTSATDESSEPAGDERLRDALDRRLGALDERVILLSGGVDSGWLASRARLSGPVMAVSVNFGETVPQVDHAAALADHLGLRHHARPLSPRLAQTWARLIDETGLPQLDLGTSAVAEAVAEAAEMGAGVVVSGLGADDLFGGYRPRGLPRAWSGSRLPTVSLRDEDLVQQYGVVPPRWAEWRWRMRLREEILAPELVAEHQPLLDAPPRAPSPPDERSWAGGLELRTRLAGRLLPALDAAARRSGVAVALPYLDEAVIAHARGLPSPRAWLSLDKPHLRRQARWDLPDDVVSRAKNPRRRPNIEWLLSDPLPEPVAEAFAPAALRLTGWFDPVGIHHALQQVRARPRHPLNRLRAQLLLIAAGVQRLALR